MTRLLPLLLVALALAGCRESLTAPDLFDNPDPILSSEEVRSMYVKAPDILLQGEAVGVRAEPLSEATHYVWSFVGPGELATTPNDPHGRARTLEAIGVEPGPALIVGRAYDARGNLLAEGSKAVEILRQ